MAIASRPASTASAQKVPRQPITWPAYAPSGTPSTLASIPPPSTMPSALELARGPAALTAATEATAQERAGGDRADHPCAQQHREVLGESAHHVPCGEDQQGGGERDPVRQAQRRQRAPTIIPSANTVIASPAVATLTE